MPVLERPVGFLHLEVFSAALDDQVELAGRAGDRGSGSMSSRICGRERQVLLPRPNSGVELAEPLKQTVLPGLHGDLRDGSLRQLELHQDSRPSGDHRTTRPT